MLKGNFFFPTLNSEDFHEILNDIDSIYINFYVSL